MIQQVRGRSPVLLVDGGEAFFGPPGRKAPDRSAEYRALTQARPVLQAYNYIGYQAVALGPGDLQFGVDKLKTFLAPARFPVLCANLVSKQSGKPVFRESVVIEVDGKKFGIYGMLMSHLLPSYRQRVLGDRYDLLDSLATTKRVVAELKGRCDHVIALSHLNVDDNETILREVPGITALVDPFSRSGTKAIWVTDGVYLDDSLGAPQLRIDGQGSRVGVFEMYFPRGASRLSAYSGYDYPLDPHIFAHPRLEGLLDEMRTRKRKEFPTVEDPTRVRLLTDDFLGHEACGACHEEQRAFWKKTKHREAYLSIEKTGDHLTWECVDCHTTGFGLTFVDLRRANEFRGVQCESCHGVNARHAEDPARFHLGKVNEATCWACHNEKITKAPFDYEEFRPRATCPKMER